MSIVGILLDTAYQDTQLIISNDESGDDFSIPRDIEFILYAKNEEEAELVTNFINDNQYGTASFQEVDNKYRIMVVVYMPSTQQLVCSVSGLMACISELFSVEYDGWGCVLQN